MTEVEPVHIITTGGTIDKTYNPNTEAFDFSGPSVIERLLEDAGACEGVSIDHFMRIDSRFMDDEHRANLVGAVRSSGAKRLVITHGTSTMPETARYFLNHAQRLSSMRTIVLTGAMKPAQLAGESDARFNLGSALTAARLSPAGVYVAMNGVVHNGGNVQKDVENGIFIPVE